MAVTYLRKHQFNNVNAPSTTLQTNETVCGDDVIGFNRPADLATYNGHGPTVKPWPVPIADYAAELASFEALCNAATDHAGMKRALNFLRANHLSAQVDDVPEAKRDLAKATVRAMGQFRGDLALRDDGSEGAWL